MQSFIIVELYMIASQLGVLVDYVPALVLLSDGVSIIDLERLTGVARNAACSHLE